MIVQNFFLVAECLCHVSLAGSIFITVSLSIERYQEGNQLTEYSNLFNNVFYTGCLSSALVSSQNDDRRYETNKHEFEIKWRTFPAMIYKDAPFCDVSFCNLFSCESSSSISYNLALFVCVCVCNGHLWNFNSCVL